MWIRSFASIDILNLLLCNVLMFIVSVSSSRLFFPVRTFCYSSEAFICFFFLNYPCCCQFEFAFSSVSFASVCFSNVFAFLVFNICVSFIYLIRLCSTTNGQYSWGNTQPLRVKVWLAGTLTFDIISVHKDSIHRTQYGVLCLTVLLSYM